MKKYFILSLALLFVLALSAVAFGAITSSVHDLRTALGDDDQICGVCHSPHDVTNPNGDPAAPLWGHVTDDTGYTMYSSPAVPDVGAPSGLSKLCLGCHDGVTALSAYHNYPGTNVDTIAAGGDLTKNLTGTHPISTPLQAGPDYRAETLNFATGVISDFLGGGAGGNVECSTCHDVHNNTEGGEVAAGAGNLLRINNANSALCFGCHIK
jgi:hypothetical protein